MKLSYVLLFLYITDFLLLLFYTFPQTQTFNSKQQQHHITVKKNNQNQNQQKTTTKPTNQPKTHTKKKTRQVLFNSLCFLFSFVIFILLFLCIHNSGVRILNTEVWNKQLNRREWMRSPIRDLWAGIPLSVTIFLLQHGQHQEAGFVLRVHVAGGKAGLQGKNFFNMEITEKFPKLTLTKTASNDQWSVPKLLSSPKTAFSLLWEI